MFKKLKWLYERRQYRKALQNALAIVRYSLPNLSLTRGSELVFAVHDFIEGYRTQFGEADGIATFFQKELKYLYFKEKRNYD